MNAADLFVAINLATTSNSPLLPEEVFTCREPHGEYVFYAASDKQAIEKRSDEELGIPEEYRFNKPHGPRIDQCKAKLNFEVVVYFEEDVYEAASGEIEDLQNDGGDTYALADGQLGISQLTVEKYFNKYFSDLDMLRYKGETGKNWASSMDLYQRESLAAISATTDKKYSIFFKYQKVEGERTLEITAFCKADDCVIGDVYKHWSSLIETYKDMPMNHFEGSNSY